MQIITGKIQSAQKVVIYGPEGIGKSTFASHFPQPLFIDTEGSTKHMDVARLPKPESWTMLLEQVRYVKVNSKICETLALDTADWAEQLCVEHICSKSQVGGIEDFGYGKGYTYLTEEFGRLLNLLEEVIRIGINVTVTAHAQMRKFEQPDELGAYDRWELKLQKKTAPLLKEWADMVLFANYKTHVVNVDNQGAQKGKNKAQGGSRVMYTTHHPCWDAKNRHGLNIELPFDYREIAHCIPSRSISTNSPNVSEEPIYWHQKELKYVFEAKPDDEIPDYTQCVKITKEEYEQLKKEYEKLEKKPEQASDIPKVEKIETTLPAKLSQLMLENKVTYEEIQEVVANKGYYTIDTPIENYDIQFIEGVLVGAWSQVFGTIKENRLNNDTPF